MNTKREFGDETGDSSPECKRGEMLLRSRELIIGAYLWQILHIVSHRRRESSHYARAEGLERKPGPMIKSV
jgi:hypothetical protein